MNNTLKKVLAAVLVVVMMMSFAAIAFATGEDVTEVVPEEEHRYIFQIFWDFIKSAWDAIRYVFYDVFLGVAP